MYYTEILTSETELHNLHGVVEKYFPEQKKHYAVNGRVISVRSEKPTIASEYKSTEVDVAKFAVGDLHGFSVTLNPIVKSRDGKVMPLRGDKEREYVVKRLAEAGVDVLKMEIEPCGVVWVNKSNNKFPVNTCRVKGILEVIDKEKFSQVVLTGLPGRCKAYGYGMLNLIA